MPYIGQSLTEGTRREYTYVATASQTTFNAIYTVGAVDVYQNGVLLAPSDYTATTGTTVVFNTGAALNDEVTIHCHNTFSVADTVSASQGGTFSGAVTHTGAFTSRGIDDNATSTAMTLDASGNLLVGTTDTSLYNNTSGGGFHVSPNGFTEVAYESANAADPTFLVNNTGADGDIIQLRKDGTVVGSIGASGGDLLVGTGDTAVRFVDADDALVPFNTNGSGRDAAIDLGKSAERFKDLYLSGGVYLGGTGAANLLDDYEEGTWTPGVGFGTTNASLSNASGKYVKVGQLVTVTFYVDFLANGSGTNARITGLTFANNQNYVLVTLVVYRGAADNQYAGYIVSSGSQINITDSGDTTSTGLSSSDFTSSSEIGCTFSYHTDA